MPSERKTILLCVLNWGIGHAARCVPLIQQWQRENKSIVIASDGAALLMLKQEFSDILFEELPPYNTIYHKGNNMVYAMAKQLPKFIKAISQEREALDTLINKHQPEMVVSDSRFGCYSSKVKSVFITHQLHLIMPWQWKFMEPMVNFINHKQILKFDECWVPDEDGEENLSGKLSQPLLPNAKYIGTLSRLKPMAKTEKKTDLMAVLSGPEPQRTILENILLKQMKQSKLKCILVRGLPDATSVISAEKNVAVLNYMNAEALSKSIVESKLLICRSGYSTVMDLAALKVDTKIVFIPTPGQTEQEYLAERLAQIGFAMNLAQHDFQLDAITKEL